MDNKIFSKTVSLYSLAKWTNGLAYKDFHFSTTGVPIIKIAELKNGITSQTQFTNDIFDESVKLNYDDLLFSWSGNPDTSIDVFRYRRNDGWLNQHIFKVVPNGVSKDYLFYLLKSLQPTFAFIASNKQTTGLGHVTIADLKSLNVYVHSLKEQRHIVDILGSIDNSIENNQSIMSNLIRLGKQILQKAYNEQRCVNRCLGDCLCLLKDGTHNPPTRVEKGIPLITGQTIDNGFIVYDKMTYIKESDYKKIHKKYAPAKNDLIITKIGTLGKVAVLRGQDIPIALHCNSALLRFSELSPAVAFLY